jgi:hypothetical protein
MHQKAGKMERFVLAGAAPLALLLSSCAGQPAPSAHDAPGFFMGFLHGLIALFSLIGSIFWDIRVYAYPNYGGWYDFGFVLGAACFFGGGSSHSVVSLRVRRQ